MHKELNRINARLSLRPPQRQSLEILDRVMEITQPQNLPPLDESLQIIRTEFPKIKSFDRDFLSLCFALATGVGKTRLMGAFISYLHLAYGIDNYFVLAPNLTIYNKLITDFTPNTPKYVLKGIEAFAQTPPLIITGDNYESGLATNLSLLKGYGQITINIFNISKINSEVRGGNSPRIKRLSEYIGDSYFNYLASLPDLVLLMDESHRYRASAGAKAINELRPILGLELTATPFVEMGKKTIDFGNVIYHYPLAKALKDGFIKEPTVATRENFQAGAYSAEEIEKIKLEDGVRMHEEVKVALQTYALQTGKPLVKPFVLVITRDTTHAREVKAWVESPQFFEGRYREKVIQVDSTTKEDEVIERLLAVESYNEPTEIVIHVNMLKEGWDVTNLYTIVPLRAANARTLIEQSIGRGLRLPYGKRTGVKEVDRLTIIAHDKFQEIIDEANRPDSIIRLEQIILQPSEANAKPQLVIAKPVIERSWEESINPVSAEANGETTTSAPAINPIFATPQARIMASLTYEIIRKYEGLKNSAELQSDQVTALIVQEVQEQYNIQQPQTTLPIVEETASADEVCAIVVKQVISTFEKGTIDIPRIVVVPKGDVTTGFNPFTLDLTQVAYQPLDQAIVTQSLQTGEQSRFYGRNHVVSEERLEDHLVSQLIDFPDIAYDEQADLLYDLATQVVRHLQGYLKDEENVRNVIQSYEKQLARLIHTQMQAQRWEKSDGYEAKVSHGFTKLKDIAFNTLENAPVHFRQTPAYNRDVTKTIYGGFTRCLYEVQKFDSNPERIMAIILDRDSEKWFKPMPGQLVIEYKDGLNIRDYQPDFVVESAEYKYLIEVKAHNELEDKIVQRKKNAAVVWCQHASEHAQTYKGKPWHYLLIPDNMIEENMSLSWLHSNCLMTEKR